VGPSRENVNTAEKGRMKKGLLKRALNEKRRGRFKDVFLEEGSAFSSSLTAYRKPSLPQCTLLPAVGGVFGGVVK